MSDITTRDATAVPADRRAVRSSAQARGIGGRWYRWVISGVGLFVVAFMSLPLLVLVIQSFGDSTTFSGLTGGLTTHWYVEFFRDPAVRDSLVASLKISLIVTVCAILIGTPSAYAFARTSFRGKRLLESLVFLPGVMPWLLLGLGMSLLFGNILPNTTSLLPVVLGQITLFLPFAFFLVLMGFRGVDLSLEEAAADLGASTARILFRITLPLIAPWMFGTVLIVFPLSFNEQIVTGELIRSGSTLPLYVGSAIRHGVTPEINAVGGMLVLPVILGAVIAVLGPSLFRRRQRPVSRANATTAEGSASGTRRQTP